MPIIGQRMRITEPCESHIFEFVKPSKSFKEENEWAHHVSIAQISSLGKAEERLFGTTTKKVLLAIDKDELVGYAGVNGYVDGEEEKYEFSILISKRYRGKGLARLLTDKLFKELEKGRKVYAFVADFNEPSLRAVPRLGFRELNSFLEKEFFNGVEAIVHVFVRES